MATIARITRIPLDPPVNILRKHFAAGSSAGVSATGWTGQAAASEGTNDTFFQLTGTFTTGGSPVCYAALFQVPTILHGFPTRISGVSLSGAKVAGTATTNKLAKIGIYQFVPTANSVNITITPVIEDATGWLAGTASATPTDINIDFTPTAVGAAGLLFMGFTFTVPDEATTYKLYHPSIRIEH